MSASGNATMLDTIGTIKSASDLIRLVSSARLELRLQELSGEREIKIGDKTTKLLTRNTFTKGAENAVQFLEQFYASIGAKTKRQTYKVRPQGYNWLFFRRPEQDATNLFAEIPGDITPEKVVFIGSHFDSQAGNRFEPEELAPGADDDGTGVVAAMEIAELVMALKAAGIKIACTIRFGHFSGEEQGLLGSRAYVSSLRSDANIVGMFMLEMMAFNTNGQRRVDLHDDADDESHKLIELLMEANKEHGLSLNVVDLHQPVYSRPSDHVPFLEKGIAACCVSEDSRNTKLNPHMHTTNDRLKNCDMEFWADVVRMLTAGITKFAGVRYES